MNIKQAKQEIENTLKAYLARDGLGNYLIPAVRQRPVLLMGPPGIGKTQIMEQIASETGVGATAPSSAIWILRRTTSTASRPPWTAYSSPPPVAGRT